MHEYRWSKLNQAELHTHIFLRVSFDTQTETSSNNTKAIHLFTCR